MDEGEYFPTLDQIDALDDVIDAFVLCDIHHVPADGLVDLEELKERLRLELFRRNGVSFKQQNVMQNTGEDNQKKRRTLTEMFEELIQIVGTTEDTKMAELTKVVLQRVQTSGNLQEDCKTKAEGLTNDDCIILVEGETWTGKSSFLNLLLESEYLPTKPCSYTSAITTLTYDTKAHAKIIYGGAEQRVVVIEELEKKGLESRFDFTFLEVNENETKQNVKEIQVFLPAEFLKCGIVLAVTPRIDENNFIENNLKDFISNNEIHGVISIICPDAEGGVQQDRHVMLLKAIFDPKKENSKAIPFDPKAALFLANNIPEDSRKKVRDHIINQLGKYWPEFDESMVVFFSTKKAMRDVTANQDYINDQYKHLLEGLSNLYKKAMDSRIRSSYKWMETVVKRISHFLKVTVTRIGWRQRENREKQRKRLNLPHQTTDAVTAELHAYIDIKRHEIVKEIQKYLSNPQATSLLCTVMKEDEIPKLDKEIKDHTYWEWIKQRIDEAFYDRLSNATNNYIKEKCQVSTIEAEIVEQIETKLGILLGEIEEVVGDLSATNSPNGPNGPDLYCSKSISKHVAGATTVTPIRLALKLQDRVANNPFNHLIKMGSCKEFTKNPKEWAQGRAKKLMTKLLHHKAPRGMDPDFLTPLVERHLQRPREMLKIIQLKFSREIETNLFLLQDIEEHALSDSKAAVKYQHMLVQVKALYVKLMNNGEGYIFVNDFKSNEIKVVQDEFTEESTAFPFSKLVTKEKTYTKSTSTEMIPQGLWTVVRQGVLQQQNQETKISIKMHMPSSGVSQTFQEVAKLRCLLHEDVYLARFLGIHHTEVVNREYIFEGHLITVERFFKYCSNPCKHKRRVLRQIAEGLQYLHCKGMVHMEVTTSTVTVTHCGEVRLTGASVPRHASLPLDPEETVCNFVYLSPEVLKKELYSIAADVYGFGILFYEIVCETKAFEYQRTCSFKEFVDELNPTAMLFPDNKHWQILISLESLDLVKKCVEVLESRRPNMNIVIEMLEVIKDDFQTGMLTLRHAMPAPGKVFRMPTNNIRFSHLIRNCDFSLRK